MLLHLPATLQLVVVSLGISMLLAVPMGVISAWRKGTTLDVMTRGFAKLGHSQPAFLLGIFALVGLCGAPNYTFRKGGGATRPIGCCP